jgi:oligopeptidase B
MCSKVSRLAGLFGLTLMLFLVDPRGVWAQLDPNVARPPVANKLPKTSAIHGDLLLDNYFWLRDKKSKEVIDYLEAENAYTAAVMKPTESFQETLYKEMLARIEQTDLSVPYRLGGYWYYTRTEQGKQYPIHCRKKGSLEGKEEVLLDLNELAAGQKFISLGNFAVSDDGNLLAYSLDVSGFREYTLFFKDVRDGKVLTDRIEKVVSVAWAADNKTLFYVLEDAAKRPYRLHRHVLGSQSDPVVYEEKDDLFRLFVSRTHDKAYLRAHSTSSTSSETRLLPSGDPTGTWRVLLPREENHRYAVEHRAGLFYIHTNKDAHNFRLVVVPAGIPQAKNWKEMVAHRPDVLLESVTVFQNHCVLKEREKGLEHLKVIDLRNGKSHRLDFAEPVYSASQGTNPEFETTVLRYHYQSLITPDSVYDYDMDSHTPTLLKQTKVLGGYDPSAYISERVFAKALDGTAIPISLVYRKGIQRDGTNPLLLYGYGAYGASLPLSFASQRLSLLDRGVIYAQAHVRGGKEMGEAWHDQGKMLAKRNSFTDFIAAADHLVAEKYAARDRMVVQGRSAGGLLIGAVVNMRPDLCKAAILEVPFVDVINTMLDASLPLTIQEYLEWGNPNIKKEYDYIKTYCPYTNLAAKDYPALLVVTSLNDSQVMFWEPAKYVAKLRTLKTDKNPLLFKTNLAAGHGGASGRYDALRERAFSNAFVLSEMGILK